MTVVDLLVIALGLAGALLLDPWAQKRITVLARSRRIAGRSRARALGEAVDDDELALLRTGLASVRSRWEDRIEGGYLSLAEEDAKSMRRIERRIARLRR